MSVLTYEGVIENGQIRLSDRITLPENTKVYVVVSEVVVDIETPSVAHVRSPRLANPAQAALFIKEVLPDDTDASL